MENKKKRTKQCDFHNKRKKKKIYFAKIKEKRGKSEYTNVYVNFRCKNHIIWF